MATQIPDKELDIQEQIARIKEHMAESDYKYREALKSEREYKFLPLTLLFQGLLAGAALFGAGAAFTKLFL